MLFIRAYFVLCCLDFVYVCMGLVCVRVCFERERSVSVFIYPFAAAAMGTADYLKSVVFVGRDVVGVGGWSAIGPDRYTAVALRAKSSRNVSP